MGSHYGTKLKNSYKRNHWFKPLNMLHLLYSYLQMIETPLLVPWHLIMTFDFLHQPSIKVWCRGKKFIISDHHLHCYRTSVGSTGKTEAPRTICSLPRHKHFTLERALEVNQPSVIIFPQFRFVFVFSVSFPALHFTNVSLFVQELTFQELSHNLPNRNGKPRAVSVHSLLLTSTTPSAS